MRDTGTSGTSGPFAVVIPMFNEEAGAEVCVKSVCMELDRLPGRSALLVVNDGSRDRTDEILHRLAPAHLKLKVITHPANRGYGRALRGGGGGTRGGRQN